MKIKAVVWLAKSKNVSFYTNRTINYCDTAAQHVRANAFTENFFHDTFVPSAVKEQVLSRTLIEYYTSYYLYTSFYYQAVSTGLFYLQAVQVL